MESDSPDLDPEAGGDADELSPEATEDEMEFALYLEEIRSEEGLKIYADVYTKLYDSYFLLKDRVVAQRGEMRELEGTIEEMKNEALQNTDRLDESNKTMAKLQTEIEQTKALCDAMHARELACVETVDTLRRQITRVERELEMRKKAGADDDAGAQSAAKEKEKFEKEKARLMLEMEALKGRLANAVSLQEELERQNSQADLTIAGLKESLEDAENNAVRTNRLVEHLKNESNSYKMNLEARSVELGVISDKLGKAEKTIEKRDRQIQNLTQRLEEAMRDMEEALAKAANFRLSLESARANLDSTKEALVNTTKELKNSIADNTRYRNDLIKANKSAVQQGKRYQLLQAAKADVESERDRLRQQTAVMEREITLGKKQNEADRREIENMNREKEIMTKTMQKIQNEALDNLQMLNLQEQRRQKLEHELEQNAVAMNKQRLTIRQLEKDKDRMLEEAIALNEKIDDVCEEVRLRTSDLTETQKELREEVLKTKRLTGTLDTCRAERNMLSKNYTEALDEIQDLKQKLKMLAYQIEQLKEDISSKEAGLKKCEGALSKCIKKTEVLKAEVQSGLVKLCDARTEIQALKQEEARLLKFIQEGDAARQKLAKEVEGLTSERDVVGAQLVRRNDEISLLYEKIRILEVTLHRGEKQYEQRIEDIRLLRLEVLRLRQEKLLLAKGIENMTDLRLEVFNLERELGRERLRVRALEEALETPLNVHRWRKLAATEPDTVNMAYKLRSLQKKVLIQSETIVLKERELKETKNLYSTVKDTLALQPSPQIQQQLNMTQRALNRTTVKLKCLVAELSMREKQVTEFRMEIAKINGELESYKSKYYECKRIVDMASQNRSPSPNTAQPPANVPAAQECK